MHAKINLEYSDLEYFQKLLWLAVHDFILERRGEIQENKLSYKITQDDKLMLSPILFLRERKEELGREIIDVEETIRVIESLLEKS
jgi:IS4 transposase